MIEAPEPTLFEIPDRLPSVEEARDYVFSIDFTHLKEKVTSPPHLGGLEWSAEKADYVEQQYKNWLFLRRKYEDRVLPPSGDIDVFWHSHMLDTRAYFRDTRYIFGYYLHHFPYFGVRSDEDYADMEAAWEDTQRLHLLEFGDEIYDFD